MTEDRNKLQFPYVIGLLLLIGLSVSAFGMALNNTLNGSNEAVESNLITNQNRKYLQNITVYANSESGSDTNTGMTSDKPVKTLSAAAMLLRTNNWFGEATIQLLGTTFTVGKDVTVNLDGLPGMVRIQGETKTEVPALKVDKTKLDEFDPLLGWQIVKCFYDFGDKDHKSHRLRHNHDTFLIDRTGTFPISSSETTDTDETINTIYVQSTMLKMYEDGFKDDDLIEIFSLDTSLEWEGQLRIVGREIRFEYIKLELNLDRYFVYLTGDAHWLDCNINITSSDTVRTEQAFRCKNYHFGEFVYPGHSPVYTRSGVIFTTESDLYGNVLDTDYISEVNQSSDSIVRSRFTSAMGYPISIHISGPEALIDECQFVNMQLTVSNHRFVSVSIHGTKFDGKNQTLTGLKLDGNGSATLQKCEFTNYKQPAIDSKGGRVKVVRATKFQNNESYVFDGSNGASLVLSADIFGGENTKAFRVTNGSSVIAGNKCKITYTDNTEPIYYLGARGNSNVLPDPPNDYGMKTSQNCSIVISS
jgi:hypothetical protein